MTFSQFFRRALTALTFVGAALVTGPTTAIASTVGPRARAEQKPVFELRIYTAHPGKLPNVLARFRDHTTKLFEKHGMVNVGYFTPLDSADGAGQKLVYVLQHKSRDAAKASWSAFGADPEWKAVAAASEVNGPIVAKVESVFLEETDFSPDARSMSDHRSRVFELRTYTVRDSLLPQLDARFRDHTMQLFSAHRMTNVQYWHPTDAANGAGRTLIYLLAHPTREAATANWGAFRTDSAWIRVKAATEQAAGGSLTTEVKSMFLAPTDFSKLH
jgi:hypothetical protein